ncbi:hypothetical protein OIV83_000286 [Microbotryomycetes sp. JL201]|nr:hypothetical protein OIV83_000286 [Microbotryomycetes sp. JL201]
MDTSKGSSAALRSLSQGTSHQAHRDREARPSSSDAAASSFRQHKQWPAAGGGTDEDFGRFTQLEQSQLANHQRDSAMPRDPPASEWDRSKGKSRADSELSDSESELVASVSSLELADREYLRSLLAQPESSSIKIYLEQGTYTDDVYGMTPAIQRVLDQSRAGIEPTSEGRALAVRRLAMVLRHVDGK